MNIGSWLHGKLVLLSPEAITAIEGDEQPIVQVGLTKEQVRRSLDAQAHRPIALQQPHDYYLYLGLPHYLNLAEHQDRTIVSNEAGPRKRCRIRISILIYGARRLSVSITSSRSTVRSDIWKVSLLTMKRGPSDMRWPTPETGGQAKKCY